MQNVRSLGSQCQDVGLERAGRLVRAGRVHLEEFTDDAPILGPGAGVQRRHVRTRPPLAQTVRWPGPDEASVDTLDAECVCILEVLNHVGLHTDRDSERRPGHRDRLTGDPIHPERLAAPGFLDLIQTGGI